MKKSINLTDQPLRLHQLCVLEDVVDQLTIYEQDYALVEYSRGNPRFSMPVAMRFDGVVFVVCIKGTLEVEVNLNKFTVPAKSVFFIPTNMVFRPMGWRDGDPKGYVLFMTQRFLHDINIDLNAINSRIFLQHDLVMPLDDDQMAILLKYFDLFSLNAKHQNSYTRLVARDITSACGYQMLGFGEELPLKSARSGTHTRRMSYVQKFLRLVRENYRRERSISFYAGCLFISSKYLSLIIKDTTGKSAGEWIDQYVIQEAKTQLRFSGKNVQQIAYELNFSNQSSFGKYFKNITGMSPTAFQNSL